MPAFIRAASQTLRSGTVLRGLADDEGKFWIVAADLSQEVEGVEESSGDSLVSHRVRSGIPGGDLFPETVFMSVTSIPHLASTVLDTPLSPGQDEKEWLSGLLGEPLDVLFAALSGAVEESGHGDEETAGEVGFVDDAPPLVVGHVLKTVSGGGLIPGHGLALDEDADVWIPVDSRNAPVTGTDPWAALRSAVSASDHCVTVVGPGSKHPALRIGDEDAVTFLLTPHAMTSVLSSPEAAESLASSVDLSSWRWTLSDVLPRALEEVAPVRSSLMKPSLSMGTGPVSLVTTAEDFGITAPALVSLLEMRGSVTRTGSALRPWKVSGDTDLLMVCPAEGHAMWCPALTSEQATGPLRDRLRLSGLLA